MVTENNGSRDPIDLNRLKSALDRHSPSVHPVDPRLHAAVAMILEPAGDEHSLLFIERARKNGDPWSGQIAFPGGRRESQDPDEQAVAVRETREEIGVVLEPGQCIGRLDDLKGRTGGTSEGMVISCFVYVLDAPAEVQPNEEVAAVARLPVSHLVDDGNRVEVDWRHVENRRFPGIRFGERDPRVVWGLTYRFLHQLFTRLGHDLPAEG